MKKNNIDHLIRIMILIFILVSIFNSFLISYYVDKITGRVTTGTATLTILILGVRAPYNLEARLNPDNISIDLNWSEIEEAGSYTIYYSSNLTELQQINLTNLSPGITKVQGITDNNWTDWNAENIQKRYYTVSSVLGTLENLSKEIVGKCDLEYIADSTGEKGRNLLTLCMNVSYTAESFIQEVPNSTVIKQLNRWDNPEKEHWEGHTPGSPVYDFPININKGYMIFVTENSTWTPT